MKNDDPTKIGIVIFVEGGGWETTVEQIQGTFEGVVGGE
jgi:hypothetical protein